MTKYRLVKMVVRPVYEATVGEGVRELVGAPIVFTAEDWPTASSVVGDLDHLTLIRVIFHPTLLRGDSEEIAADIMVIAADEWPDYPSKAWPGVLAGLNKAPPTPGT